MKHILIISALLFLCIPVRSLADSHPRVYVTDADRKTVLQKIEKENWAKETYMTLRASVEKYADRHMSDPEWIVSRLAMYWKDGERYTQCYLKNQNWDYGEGNAPVPTVRLPGMRTWNRYVNVPLEDRIPYNESGDMLGMDKLNPEGTPVVVPYKKSGHMVRGNNVEILTLAENAAFVHWLTGEEKFARFASDIFNAWLVGTWYMNPVLDPGRSCGSGGGWEPGGICGYYDYEQIHDDLALHAAMVYDFLYDYLTEHPHPHLKTLGKGTKEVAEEVFRRFITLGMVRGDRKGNWNVNGWNMILRPILVLDGNGDYPDGKGREYYLHTLLRESTAYRASIPDMVKNYDKVTGLWPESPGYAFSTVRMLLDWAEPLERAGTDIIAGNPVIEKAALAVLPWTDGRGNLLAFGDFRGGAADFRIFENLLSYYIRKGNVQGAAKVSAALSEGMERNRYNRQNVGWEGLCTYEPLVVSEDEDGPEEERVSYSPFHRCVVMKNGKGSDGLMAVLYGGRKGSHLSANGLALQLYGFGYALAPDAAAYESYWSNDHAYHQGAAGSNTVLPGYTEGNIQIEAMEPSVDRGQFTGKDALVPYLNFADISAGEKRRMVALVKVSEEAGYYVDIFRSDLDDNDYLFHNIGLDMTLYGKDGKALPVVPVDSLTPSYNVGYSWFENLRSCSMEGAFRAEWTLPEGIVSRLWMAGEKGRKVYTVSAPPTTLTSGITPGDCGVSPRRTPALLVRQMGNNAWRHPFMGVYEAFRTGGGIVRTVSALSPKDGACGLRVELADGRCDWFISSTGKELYEPDGMLAIQGTFAQVSVKDSSVVSLYLGKGSRLRCGDWTLRAVGTDPVYAAVYRTGGTWHYAADKKIEVEYKGRTLTVEGKGTLDFDN